MDQVSHETHLPNGAQPPTQAQTLIETPASLNPLGPRTPLGEPMDQSSASYLVQSPLAWHLNYWLNLEIIGILRGEDPMLMSLRVQWEQATRLGEDIKTQLLEGGAWAEYRRRDREEWEWFWAQMTLECEVTKPYLRDVDRMLVNKAQKTRACLRHYELMMLTTLRANSPHRARWSFEQIAVLHQKLHEEETADAEARDRLSNGITGAHNQEGQGSEAVEVENAESDEDASDEKSSNEESSDEESSDDEESGEED